MARPIAADAEGTRRRILERSVALFGERGLEGVSIREIAAAAGVSLAMVHHYFGSKEALYQACIDAMYEKLETMRPRLLEALAGGGALDELIERAVRTAFRFAREHRVQVRLLQRQIMEAGELDERRSQASQMPFLAQATVLLGRWLGRPAASLRLPLQSVVVLTSRFAASSDAELTRFTGRRGAAAVMQVEDHLVHVAQALLLGAAPNGRPSRERVS